MRADETWLIQPAARPEVTTTMSNNRACDLTVELSGAPWLELGTLPSTHALQRCVGRRPAKTQDKTSHNQRKRIDQKWPNRESDPIVSGARDFRCKVIRGRCTRDGSQHDHSDTN